MAVKELRRQLREGEGTGEERGEQSEGEGVGVNIPSGDDTEDTSQTVTSSRSQSPCDRYSAECFPELPHFNNTMNWVLLLLLCYNQPRQHIKKQRHYFANKGLSSQSFGFSSSHVWT